MDLLRTWVRQLAGASAAALAVPVAVGGALVVLALGGGFGSLGSLGEIFSGPRESVAPAAARQAAPAAARVFAASAALAATASARSSRPAATPARALPGHSRGVLPPVSRAPVAVTPTVGAPVPPIARVAAPSVSTRGVAAAAPPGPRSVSDQVVGVAGSVAVQLPAPVRQTAGGVVQSAASALPPAPAVPPVLPRASLP